jgi:hypothetical protein
MKIGIFTPYLLEPIHPRTEMYLSFFKQEGIDCSIEHSDRKPGFLTGLLSRSVINMFDIKAIACLSGKIKNYDIVFIQDLKYLPLSIIAKFKRKKVIYETLDNSVFIRVYSQKKSFFYPAIRFLTPAFCAIEKTICRIFTDHIIVNSHALKKHFNNRAELIFYSSPFESSGIENNPLKKPAFLYLGAISPDKGINEILDIINTYQIPAYFFGNCTDAKVINKLKTNLLITWKNRMNSNRLTEELKILSNEFYLIGFSLIKSIHYSYATQEANKEIDYLSMGIPFIGNRRMTTIEKIVAGCGIFENDNQAVLNLLQNKEQKILMEANCRKYYDEHYSTKLFEAKVRLIFN